MSAEPPETPGTPAPWDAPGWPRRRLRELAYTLLSWPYLLSFAFTWLFVAALLGPRLTPHVGLLRDLVVMLWGLSFLRREAAKIVDAKAAQMGNGKAAAVPSP